MTRPMNTTKDKKKEWGTYHRIISKEVNFLPRKEINNDTKGEPKVCQSKPREEKIEKVVL